MFLREETISIGASSEAVFQYETMGGKCAELTWHLMDADFPRNFQYTGIKWMRSTGVHAG